MSNEPLRLRDSAWDTLVAWQRVLNHALNNMGNTDAPQTTPGSEPAVVVQTASGVITHSGDMLILCRNSDAIALTLSAPVTGRRLSVAALNAAVTINAAAGLLVAGESSFMLLGGETLSMVANAEGWWAV